MRKRRRHQAADVDLPDALPPFPGEEGVLLQELEGVLDGGLVCLFDLRDDLRVGDRPQTRHRLHR